jgi:hypothetical protein
MSSVATITWVLDQGFVAAISRITLGSRPTVYCTIRSGRAKRFGHPSISHIFLLLTMRVATILLGLFEACAAVSAVNRKACQYPSKNPLDGCPKNTLLVGPGQKYATVQSAVLSLPNDTAAHHILILPGNYTEQVNVTRPGPVYLFGQTRFPNDQSRNSVNIIWRNATGAGVNSTIDNAYTSTLTVAPTFNSSTTGSGPSGMYAYNISVILVSIALDSHS